MNRTSKQVRFGNCQHCKAYSKLDSEGLCGQCSTDFLELLETAARIVQKNPSITSVEVAEQMGIPVEQVNEWIRQGKLRCIAIRFNCPTCKREITNKLTCSYCGYVPDLSPSTQEKPKSRITLANLVLDERFSRDRKRPSLRWRLLASLPGIFRSSSSDS